MQMIKGLNGIPLKINDNGEASIETTDIQELLTRLVVPTRKLPMQLPVQIELIPTGENRVKDLGKNGTVYAINSGQLIILKSTDWGANFTTVATMSSTISQLRKLDNGAILVACFDGTLWLSDVNEANFIKVHTYETPGSYCSPNFGLKVYGNIIIIGEYGGSSLPNNPRRAYISDDYGKTWRKVFEGLNINDYHLHDVAYDVYENLLWACCGNLLSQRLFHYSDDMGKTWNTIADNLPDPTITQIIPLPNCVLFGSDDQSVSVWRYDRNQRGQYNRSVKLTKAWGVRGSWSTSIPYITGSYVHQGADAFAVFGYVQNSLDVKLPSALYYTNNGYDFTCLWSTMHLPTASNSNVGVNHVYGMTDDGYLVASIRDVKNGNEYWMLKVKIA